MTRLLIIFSLLISVSFAEETKRKVSFSDVYETLKDGPFSLSTNLYNNGIRDNEDGNRIKGVDVIMEGFLSYEHNDRHDFRLGTSSGITFKSNTHENHGLDFVEFRHRLLDILNEEDHGITLHSEHRIGKYTSGRVRNENDSDCYLQHRFSLNKKITDDFTIDLITRFDIRGNVTKEDDKIKNLYRFYFIPSLTLNDRFSISGLTLFSNSKKRGIEHDSLFLLIQPSLSYKMSPDVTASVYSEIIPIKSNDGKTIAKDPLGSSTLGFNLSASLF